MSLRLGFINYVKCKAVPVQVSRVPEGFRSLRLPEVFDSRHMNVARFSALRTGRLYPPGNIPGTYFC